MEPIWLGLTAPSIFSTAGNAGRAALRPFSAALELASGLLDNSPAPPESVATLSAEKNPHTSLLSDLLTGVPLNSDGTIEIADIRTHADSLQDGLQRRIHELLQAAGIMLDEPVQLRVSPVDGQLEVASDSPQRAVLEATLASDQNLAADFRQLAAARSLLSAADENSEFAEVYAQDPFQAVNDFAHLFDGRQEAQLLATLSEAELMFEVK
jgi:hypothetical protein